MTKEQSETADNNSELSSDDGKEQSDRKESENDSANSNGPGSGSGQGYNGDCSSDDASSSESSSKQKTAPGLAHSIQKLDINKRREDNKCEEVSHDETPRKEAKNTMDPWECDDNKRKNWNTASATQVGIQINALAAIIEQNRRYAEEAPLAPSEKATLPQWNGIRISHPMDPRIDLGAVGHIPGSIVPVAASDSLRSDVAPHENVALPTVDNYLNLMEAVRPFFLSYGFPLPVPPNDQHQPNPGSTEGGWDNNAGTGSSEGFTAFFTTTEKSNSSDSSDRKSNVKCSENKLGKAGSSLAGSPNVGNEQEQTTHTENQDCAGESDASSSSMAVLARVKRKHQRKWNAEGDSLGSSGPPDGNNGSSNQMGYAVESGDVDRCRHSPAPLQPKANSSSSSSSESNPRINIGQDLRQNIHHDGSMQAHVVSETNTATNTSGSGSGGQSGSNSGTNSGSGSNQGSSGSGNENPGSCGSGNEGKGSSDDAVAQDDNSGADGKGEQLPIDVDHAESHLHRQYFVGDELSQEDDMSRENRLLDKKRKRMNMRREYEEQVQQNLESEDSPVEEVEIRPGKPVTLDAVLSFTRIARVVVQSNPPFPVVHANAAFTALTGIDAHSIIGKPIRSILSVPESKRGFSMACFDRTDALHSGESSMTNSASANHQQTQFGVSQQQNLGEHGQQHETTNGTLNYEAAAAAGQARANSSEVHEVNIERLVAASGYGEVHLLNVCSKPYHVVGRNVTVFRDIQRTEHHSEGSHGSSLASNDAHFHCVTCRIGVSPVISTSQALDLLSPQVVTDHENSNKRRKHHHIHRRHQRASLVTHYCIQLEKVVSSSHESAQQNFGGSQSSQSVSNDKPIAAEQHAELSAGVIEHAGEHSSQSSDPREPVTTIG